jgi:uncharacterized protein
MRRILFLFISLSLVYQGISAKEEPFVASAKEFLAFLVEKDYEKASSMFSEVLLEQMPHDRLGMVWNSVQSQAGTFVERTDLYTEKSGGYDVVVQTCKFEKSDLDFKLVFDSEGKIGGIFFTPPRPKESYILPPYNRPENYTAEILEVVTGEFRLPATLTMPRGDGPFPVFILVHGSGAHDRDETIGPNKPFADLAAGLSSNGIAVLRYEKRNFVYGAKGFEGLEANLYYETIEDVLSAIDLVRTKPRINQKAIYILGHSLGAMAAPRIAAKVPGLAGIVMMAGNARPLEDLILEQVTYLSSDQKTPEVMEYMEKIKQQVANVKKLEKNPEISAENLPMNIPASYWLDLKKNSQTEIARSLDTKILILQGERDYQVTMADFNLWKKQLRRKKNVNMKSYPSLNHLFLEGEGKSLPKEYDIRGNIPWYVIKDILDWAK